MNQSKVMNHKAMLASTVSLILELIFNLPKNELSQDAVLSDTEWLMKNQKCIPPTSRLNYHECWYFLPASCEWCRNGPPAPPLRHHQPLQNMSWSVPTSVLFIACQAHDTYEQIAATWRHEGENTEPLWLFNGELMIDSSQKNQKPLSTLTVH